MAAKGLVEFVNPYRQPQFVKAVRLQMKEIEGKQAFNQGLYHSDHYEKLIKSLSDSRQKYRQTINPEIRKQIAQEEYLEWNKYIELRRQELPDEFQVNQQSLYELQKSHEIYYERDTVGIRPQKLLDAFNSYAKLHKFQIPIDNWCILQLVNPTMGYLTQVNKIIKFEEVKKIIETQIVATFEKSLGQELLFQEICSLAFWNFYTQKGYMDFQEFSEFIKMFKFTVKPENLIQEFKFASQIYQGEFSKDISLKDSIVRFDFYRYIFLERNL
ncbi:hypothetical protein pb186bvf_007759 [Paramecium bursaria]